MKVPEYIQYTRAEHYHVCYWGHIITMCGHTIPCMSNNPLTLNFEGPQFLAVVCEGSDRAVREGGASQDGQMS